MSETAKRCRLFLFLLMGFIILLCVFSGLFAACRVVGCFKIEVLTGKDRIEQDTENSGDCKTRKTDRSSCNGEGNALSCGVLEADRTAEHYGCDYHRACYNGREKFITRLIPKALNRAARIR